MFLRHLPEAPRARVHVLECTATDEMRAVSGLVYCVRIRPNVSDPKTAVKNGLSG